MASGRGAQHGRWRAGGNRPVSRSVLRDEPAEDPGHDLPDRAAVHAVADADRTAPSSPPGGIARSSIVPRRATSKTVWLHFDGINYRANIWLNGRRLAAANEVAGVFRTLPVRRHGAPAPRRVRTCSPSRSWRPSRTTSSIMWVDWNPTPPTRTWASGDRLPDATSGPRRAPEPARRAAASNVETLDARR